MTCPRCATLETTVAALLEQVRDCNAAIDEQAAEIAELRRRGERVVMRRKRDDPIGKMKPDTEEILRRDLERFRG